MQRNQVREPDFFIIHLLVFFAEMFRGSQQGRQPAIMLPCHSPQSFRLTLHFLRLLRRAKIFRYLHPHIRSLSGSLDCARPVRAVS